LIKEFCLIKLFIITSISFNFKGYQIYLFYMKEYLFHFDDQQIYRNGYIEFWIELTTDQVIIFKIIVSLIFYIQIPHSFPFQYIIGRLNEISF